MLIFAFKMHFRFQKIHMVPRNLNINKDTPHMTLVMQYLFECNMFAVSSKMEFINCFNNEVNGITNLRRIKCLLVQE